MPGSPFPEDIDETRYLPPQLRTVEAAWSQLRPRADHIDRDRLFFLAGRAAALDRAHRLPSRTPTRWFLPTYALSMTGVAAILLVLLVVRLKQTESVAPFAAGATANAEQDRAANLPSALVPHEVSPPGLWTAGKARRLSGDSWSFGELASSDLPNTAGVPISDDTVLSRRSLGTLLNGESGGEQTDRASSL